MTEMRLRTGMRVCFTDDAEYVLGVVLEHDREGARIRWDDGAVGQYDHDDACIEPAQEEN